METWIVKILCMNVYICTNTVNIIQSIRKIAILFIQWISECSLLTEQLVFICESVNKNYRLVSNLHFEKKVLQPFCDRLYIKIFIFHVSALAKKLYDRYSERRHDSPKLRYYNINIHHFLSFSHSLAPFLNLLKNGKGIKNGQCEYSQCLNFGLLCPLSGRSCNFYRYNTYIIVLYQNL